MIIHLGNCCSIDLKNVKAVEINCRDESILVNFKDKEEKDSRALTG